MNQVAWVARVARHGIAITFSKKHINNPTNNLIGNNANAYMVLFQECVR